MRNDIIYYYLLISLTIFLYMYTRTSLPLVLFINSKFKFISLRSSLVTLPPRHQSHVTPLPHDHVYENMTPVPRPHCKPIPPRHQSCVMHLPHNCSCTLCTINEISPQRCHSENACGTSRAHDISNQSNHRTPIPLYLNFLEVEGLNIVLNTLHSSNFLPETDVTVSLDCYSISLTLVRVLLCATPSHFDTEVGIHH